MERRNFIKKALVLAGGHGYLGAGLGLGRLFGQRRNKERLESRYKGVILNEQDVYFAASAAEIAVRGKVPRELTGALFRNGPGIKDFYGQIQTHFFDGHGVVSAFYFADGKVRHLARVTPTDRYQLENKARRTIYPLFGTQVAAAGSNGESLAGKINQANINAVIVDKKLWALNEATSFYQLDPKDLSLIRKGFSDEEFADWPFPAHPRVDMAGRKIYAITYLFGSAGFVVYRLNFKGGVEDYKVVELARTPMVHDSIITDRYILCLVPPYSVEIPADFAERPIVAGFEYFKQQAARVYVFRKDDLALARVFELAPQFVFHFDNAYEEGDKIVTHYPSYADAHAVVNEAFAAFDMRNIVPRQEHVPTYRKLVLDMRTGGVLEEALTDTLVEFPRINNRFGQQRNRYTALVGRKDAGGTFTDVLYMDNARGKYEAYRYEEGGYLEEHVVVAKEGKTSERAVWIMGMVHYPRQGYSELNIFDGEGSLSKGPIAVARLPYMIHYCFHGNYYDQSAYS